MGTATDMWVEENMAIADRRGMRRGLRWSITNKDRESYKEALAQLDLGLEDRLSTKMGLLSGGQRQAVTLLMATMKKPKLLLLDEHTAALDPKTAEIIMQLTGRIVAEKQLTTIMVTHNLRYAVEYGDRLLMMHQGHLEMDISGAEREGLRVEHLLSKFNEISIECGN